MNTTRKTRKGAIQSAELLIVLPILGLVGAALFQYGMFFMQQQRLRSATDAAIRVAAKHYLSEYEREEQTSKVFYEALGDVQWKDEVELEVTLRQVDQSLAAAVVAKVPSKAVLPDLLGWVGLGMKDEDRMTASALLPLL